MDKNFYERQFLADIFQQSSATREIIEDKFGNPSLNNLLYSTMSSVFQYSEVEEDSYSSLALENSQDPVNSMWSLNSSTKSSLDLFFNGTSENTTTDFDLMPIEMREMSSSARTSVLIYAIIWIIASTGNLTVFASCYKQYKKHKSRIALLILHLSVADLIVTFCLIPIEIAWRITIQWYGGNVLCKLCQLVRAFGLYLSSMVLICVSFDRFFSILFPLKFAGGKHRVKVMLALAWLASVVFSLPQAIFFSVENHPKFKSFRQCVTSLSTQEDVKMYSIFSVSAMYFAPLLVIILTYTAILLKIIRKSRQQTMSQCATMSTTASNTLANSGTSRIGSVKKALRLSNSTGNTLIPLQTCHRDPFNSSTSTFTPSPKSTKTSMRFNFSQSSIERTSSCRSRGESVRWKGGNLLRVPDHTGDSNPVELVGSKSAGASPVISDDMNKASSQRKLQDGKDQTVQLELDETARITSTSKAAKNTHTFTNSNINGISSTSNIANDASTTNANTGINRTMSMRSNGKTQLVLRMSTNATSNITRAKSRTLRLTIVIVVVFVLCWTPYCVMTLWYMFDWAGAQKVDARIQDALFMMAVANSCVNPLIYGSFTKNCCGLTKKLHRNRTQRNGRPTTIKEALESQASNN